MERTAFRRAGCGARTAGGRSFTVFFLSGIGHLYSKAHMAQVIGMEAGIFSNRDERGRGAPACQCGQAPRLGGQQGGAIQRAVAHGTHTPSHAGGQKAQLFQTGGQCSPRAPARARQATSAAASPAARSRASRACEKAALTLSSSSTSAAASHCPYGRGRRSPVRACWGGGATRRASGEAGVRKCPSASRQPRRSSRASRER